MGRILCLVGIHRWEHHVNHEMGGRAAGYDLCARCHKEKNSFEGGNPAFKGLL